MTGIRHVAVIDIGKSNAKLALVDLDGLEEIAVRKMPNRPLADGPYLHHDTESIWEFILDSLGVLGREHKIDAVAVTSHGATAALLEADGGLAMPILDYEHDGPQTLRAEYDAVRPAFEETGSPRLPLGLNLGAQLFWQDWAFPTAFARAKSILMYPQYWSFRLTGIATSEVTSLGCHTDLWNPHAGDYSSLVDRMGWRKLFPPLRPARDQLGTMLPEVARRTGLAPATPVFCGIHDSNASLLPHLMSRRAPFAVVSTGTWIVVMAVGGRSVELDPARDTLINVSALGEPVPSARFMGGREHEMLTAGNDARPSEADIASVIAGRIMLLPSVQEGSGPFPHSSMRWIANDESSPGERAAAAIFYLALMTATCLDLTGAQGEVIVEGPFAGNRLFLDMLGAATGRPVLPQAGQATGTSIGAALLCGTPESLQSANETTPPIRDGTWRDYARAWRRASDTT